MIIYDKLMDMSDTLFNSLNPLPMFNTPRDLCMYYTACDLCMYYA